MQPRHYSVKLTVGEVSCPRKSNPFPAIIGAMACLSLNRQNPAACETLECTQLAKAAEQGQCLRKHASEAMSQLVPTKDEGKSGAEDDTHDTP